MKEEEEKKSKIPANTHSAKHLVVESPTILQSDLGDSLTDHEQSNHALLIPQLAPLQLQLLQHRQRPQVLRRPRRRVDLLTPHQSQPPQIGAEPQSADPPAVHAVVPDRQLLQRMAAFSDCADSGVAPLAAAQLHPHQPLPSVRQNRQPDVRQRRVVDPVDGADDSQHPEVPAGGDGAERQIAAAVELELLQRAAANGDGGEAEFGRGNERQPAEIRTSPSEKPEPRVDRAGRQQKILAYEGRRALTRVQRIVRQIRRVDREREEAVRQEDLGGERRIDERREEIDAGERRKP